MGPAYRIVTPQISLRCMHPADAPELRDAIARARSHLAPWVTLPPVGQSLDVMVARLRDLRARFDTDRDLHYIGRALGSSEVVGVASLELDTVANTRRVGGWICPEVHGTGIGFEGVAAITRVGFEVLGIERAEIRTDPRNELVSLAAEKLGFSRDGVVRGLERINGARTDQELWTMLADEYPGSGASGLQVQAFDALDRRIL